jgi:hypothetical protein
MAAPVAQHARSVRISDGETGRRGDKERVEERLELFGEAPGKKKSRMGKIGEKGY